MAPILPLLAAAAAGASAPASGIGKAVAAMVEGVAQPDADTGTTGSLEASFANATGNTENLTLILGAKVEVDEGAHEHAFQAGARYAESAPRGEGDRQRTQEAFFASYQLDADLSDRLFAFARSRYDYDAFSGFEHRVFAGGGLGYRFAESDALNWTVSGGPGVRWTRIEVPEDEGRAGETQAEFSAYAASDLGWDVNEAVSFEHDARVTYTETSTTLESEAALRSKLTERLSARVSYRVQHETMPPEGREATDTLLTAGVTWGF